MIDGCDLKEKYGDKLFVIIAKDTNYKNLSIAFIDNSG